MTGLVGYHWGFNRNLLKIEMDKKFYVLYKGFKYGILEGLFNLISLGSEDVIVLLFLVGASVGASVGSYEGFKYFKVNGTLVESSLEVEGIFYLVSK